MVLGQNLGQIMSNVVKRVKKQAILLGFFHILLGKCLLKQKVVIVKPPVRTKFLPDLGQKWQENW